MNDRSDDTKGAAPKAVLADAKTAIVGVIVAALFTTATGAVAHIPAVNLITFFCIMASSTPLALVVWRARTKLWPALLVVVLVGFAAIGVISFAPALGQSMFVGALTIAVVGAVITSILILSRWGRPVPDPEAKLGPDTSAGKSSERSAGWASTGIVSIAQGNQPAFVLIANRNFDGKEIMWLPPGGHFDLDQDPLDELLRKVYLEVGIKVTPIPHDGLYGPDDTRELSTHETHWWPAPAFVLREHLYGGCSQRHTDHIDFIYLLWGSTPPSDLSRYGGDDFITVLVDACSESAEAAERAIADEVRKWERRLTGKTSATSSGVSRDVAQRLHLASPIVSNYFATSASIRGI